MDFFTAQLRQLFRRLGRAPIFTFITLFTLAAGIGGNTAVFSVLDGVLLKPLPYPHPDRLVGVWQTATGLKIPRLKLGPSDYFVFREQSRTFEDFAIYQGDSVSVTGTGQPEQVPALDVTDGLLPLLGVTPAAGRLFSPQDDLSNAPKTVMLSYAYWQQRYGGQRSAIGKTLVADGSGRQIIGVLPRHFHFLDRQDADLILPLRFDRSKVHLGGFGYSAIARLKPGVTLAEANADEARMLPIVLRSFPAPQGFSIELFEKARIGPDVHSLKNDVIGNVGRLLWVLMGSLGLVLLIACANVANLLLVRAEGRQQELATRAALGASRGRIAGEMLFDSCVLGLLGSVLGLGLAYAGLRLLIYLAPSGLPRLDDIGINPPVLLFTLAISLFASLLFGLIPVLKYSGAHASTGLREGGRTLSQSRSRLRARNVLVTVQVSLAVVLLIGSGLMIRTFQALTHVQAGFAVTTPTQTFRIYIPSADVKDPVAVLRTEQAIREKIAAIPGVTSVGFANSVPMDDSQWMDPVWARDRNYARGELPALRRFIFISPDYLHTVGISLVAGRNLTWSDTYNQWPVALVSENFAREYWKTPQDALGKQIRVSTMDEWRQIIGVVGNVHYDGMNQPAPTIAYWPILTAKFESNPLEVRREVAFAVRSPMAGSQSLLKEVRRAVWSVDAKLPLAGVHELTYYFERSMARTSFTLVMLGIAGAMALLLGTVGLYGVIAYSVSQRTREIGIRIALGARRGQLTGMFVRKGLIMTGIGIVFGLGTAFAALRLTASLLFGITPADPLTYLVVTIGLTAAASLASYLPSRRAASVDPVEALRAE